MIQKIVNRKAERHESAEKQKLFSRKQGSARALDAVDRKLLGLLQKNARATYAETGQRAYLSAPAVYERVKRMEHDGVIQKYTVTIDPGAVGLPFCAFVRIGTAGEYTCDSIVAKLAENPEIEECHSIAGEDTLLVKARTRNPIDLENLIRKIRSIPGVVTSVTTVVLMTRFERGMQVPVPEQ